eukprot:ANDGO_03238.mRNA.1 COP9 signalosome complex subunit 4
MAARRLYLETDPDRRVDALRTHGSQCIVSNNAADLDEYISFILSDACQVHPAAVRGLLDSVISTLSSISVEHSISLSEHFASLLQPRMAMAPEQYIALRQLLAARYESQGMYTQAARSLSQIPMDQQVSVAMSNSEKAHLLLRITMLFLEDEEHASAEMALTRASSLVSQVDDAALHAKQKACFSRIQDAKRKFLEAALQYYQLSTMAVLSVTDRMVALDSAIVCSILAKAGPQRTKLLQTIMKDSRSRQASLFHLFERVVSVKTLRKEHLSDLDHFLKDHQRSQVEHAVLEHNIDAVARCYNNIRMDALAKLLGMDRDRTERTVLKMVAEDRLNAVLDQKDNVIVFQSVQGSGWTGFHDRIAHVCALAQDISVAIPHSSSSPSPSSPSSSSSS